MVTKTKKEITTRKATVRERMAKQIKKKEATTN
jgi:hypothetical protein